MRVDDRPAAFSTLRCSKWRTSKPIDSLTSLRKWLHELKEYKPSLAARAPASGNPLRALDAAGGGLARIDAFLFSRLINDLDPLARLRDVSTGLENTVVLLDRQVSPSGRPRVRAAACMLPRARARGHASTRAA